MQRLILSASPPNYDREGIEALPQESKSFSLNQLVSQTIDTRVSSV